MYKILIGVDSGLPYLVWQWKDTRLLNGIQLFSSDGCIEGQPRNGLTNRKTMSITEFIFSDYVLPPLNHPECCSRFKEALMETIECLR